MLCRPYLGWSEPLARAPNGTERRSRSLLARTLSLLNLNWMLTDAHPLPRFALVLPLAATLVFRPAGLADPRTSVPAT